MFRLGYASRYIRDILRSDSVVGLAPQCPGVSHRPGRVGASQIGGSYKRAMSRVGEHWIAVGFSNQY